MKANKLKHQDFQVEHFETDKQIFMQTFKPGTKELLGYILFKHKPVGESKERVHAAMGLSLPPART